MGLNLVLLLVSGAILLLNGGHFAQPLNFTLSPNPGYQSGMAMLSFVVFAIFADNDRRDDNTFGKVLFRLIGLIH